MIDAINAYLAKKGIRLTNRGIKFVYVVIAVLALLIGIVFGYLTHDICYVGEGGNFLGYGSCEAMIDGVMNK